MTPSKTLKVIIVLGPPGSGKGTQSKLLVKKFNLDYFGAGDALRERQKIGDFTSKRLIKVMGEGKWVPSFLISKIWMDKLEEFKQKKKFKGFISDGSPRMLPEAKLFDDAMEWYGWTRGMKIIFISISLKASLLRLTKRRQCRKCGRLIPWIGEFKKLERCDRCGGQLITRHDDKPEAIRMRLREFKNKTMLVINHYKKQKKLIKINGEQSIENIFKDILKALK